MPCLPKLLDPFKSRVEKPQNPVSSKALRTTDILLSIIPFVDVETLLNLRLVNRTSNSIITENEAWICNHIARNQYAWIFDCSGRAHRDEGKVPLQIRRFSTISRLIRLHISSILACLLLWSEFKDADGHDIIVVPANLQASSCARGFLLLWDLADIGHKAANTSAFSMSLRDYLAPLEEPRLPKPMNEKRRIRWLQVRDMWRNRFVDGLMETWRFRPRRLQPRPRGQKSNSKTSERSKLFSSAVRSDRETLRAGARQGLQEKLAYAKDLDQGAWADVQAATAAILAYCNLYMSNMMRDYVDAGSASYGGGTGVLDHDSLRQSIEWLVREGPALLLGILSPNAQLRKQARHYIVHNWLCLPQEERGWHSGLYGTSWDADEARPEYDFRALLLWNGVFYRHSRQEEWNAAGYPTLWECVIETLRQWDTYDLQEEPQALALATRLREFKIRKK